jgi:peptidoglycan hydrolase-like protein with peptidoglycan-binding domain
MGLSHKDFRALLSEAFRRRFSREPSRREAQFVHAVAELETSCGDGWADPEHDAAWNFGAIQAGSTWNKRTFIHKDTTPLSDGSSREYITKFRAYDTPIEGAEDLVRVVYQARSRDSSVLPEAQQGDSLGVSRALYQTAYFEGFGRTPEERIGHHHLALTKALERIARDLQEPLPDGSDPPELPARVMRQGSQGPDVAWMQRALGIVPADGVFGPRTSAAVVAWQRANRLKPDGFFGPVSRKVLEETLPGELLDDELEETRPE